MTRAICIECGAEKLGALTASRNCGFCPAGSQAQAKSMMLCDHYLSDADLDAIADKLKRGEPVVFDSSSVQQLAETIASLDEQASRAIRSITRFAAISVAIVGALVALVWFMAR
jgi:hypothetical protein